jgi:hypothetical protein
MELGYLEDPIFEEYATVGSYVLKEIIHFALNRLLPEKTLETNLLAQGIVTLQEQILHNRRIVHLLYASRVRRGKKIEVIEDIPTFYDVSVTIRSNKKPIDVYLAPQLSALPFDYRDNQIHFTVAELSCHQMIVTQY